MNPDDLKLFGEELKKAREEASITLTQISSKTRIDIKFLEAIEDGNFEVLPDVYIRAFIKEYADYIGLDKDETIENFESARKGKYRERDSETKQEEKFSSGEAGVPDDKNEKSTESVKEDQSEKVESSEKDEPKKERKEKPEKVVIDDSKKDFGDYGGKTEIPDTGSSPVKNYLPYGIIAFIAAVIIGAVYFIFIYDSNEQIVKETPFEQVLEKQQQNNQERFSMDESEPEAKTPAVKTDSLTLRITATDTCWVNTITDGDTTGDFLLYPNGSKSIKALDSFELVLGNAGGVNIYLNGNELDHNGRAGQRQVLKINENGIVR